MSIKNSNDLAQVLERSLKRSREGVIAFLHRFVVHDGTIRINLLYKVCRDTKGELSIRKACPRDTVNDFAIGMGGEIPNSFSPLYEISYFFQCLFLSSVATVFLKTYDRYWLRDLEPKLIRIKVLEFIETLSGDDIAAAMQSPTIPIICSLDTDIELLRYGKHQLWNIAAEGLTRCVSSIDREYFQSGPIDESLKGIYWNDEDQEVALSALHRAQTLPEAKIYQFYETLRRVVSGLGLDLDRIPLFFNLATIDEVRSLGPESEFLDILMALHDREARSALRIITRQNHPWVLTFSCPRCGQSSKRVLQSRMMADGRTVKVHCRHQEKHFRNEMGSIFKTSGCGYKYEVEIPNSKDALYKLLYERDFSIHFAARQLIAILKTSVDAPVALVVTDVGVQRDSNCSLIKNTAISPGYGDHFDMLTSMLAVETFFLDELLLPGLSRYLKDKGVMTTNPLMILGYDHPARLVDKNVVSADAGIPVTDTSALKAIDDGITSLEMLELSISFHHFELEQMLELRDSRKSSFFEIRRELTKRKQFQ